MTINHQRYFSATSLDYPKNEIGLPIDMKDFETPSTHLLENAPKITRLLGQCSTNLHEDENEFEDIELNSLGPCAILLRF